MFKISPMAARFYKEEMVLEEGDAIKFFVRHGGAGSQGFSLGVEKDVPRSADLQTSIEGITFFTKPDDQWFVEGVTVNFDETNNDITFSYVS